MTNTGQPQCGTVEVRLGYRDPFDVEGLIEFLGRRAVAGIEALTDGAYRRSLRLAHGIATVELRAQAGYVQARFWLQDVRDLDAGVKRCRALLDLDCEPGPIVDALGRDPLLGPFVYATPGRRVAGHVDPHELAVRAVLGQQISLAAAATLAARLTLRYGEPLRRPAGELTHTFPTAAALARARAEELGMPASRARALLALTSALASGTLVLDSGVDREQARAALLELPGIGPWTAEYIAMRALRDPDAFLATDLGIRRALELLGHDGRPAAAAQLAERWRPYRAYAAQHLWAIAAGAAPRSHGRVPSPLDDPLGSRVS